MILFAEIDSAHKNCLSFLMPTRLLCYCPVSAVAVRMHKYWTAAVRQRSLADIEIRECFARQENNSAVVSLASCIYCLKNGAVSAAAAAADGDAGGYDNGRKHNNLECRPSNSMIWSADRQIRRFGVPTVRFNNLECRPSNSTIEGADCETAQGYPGECIPKVLLNVEHQVF